MDQDQARHLGPAVPSLGYLFNRETDLFGKAAGFSAPYLASGKMEWDEGGSGSGLIAIIQDFFGIKSVDDAMRGVGIFFAPSCLGVTFWTVLAQLASSLGPRLQKFLPRRFWLQNITRYLLPILLVFRTGPVLAMYLSPEADTRHRWSWEWQLAPLWFGIANFVAAHTIAPSPNKLSSSSSAAVATSSRGLLAVLGLISASVWGYTLLSAPYSMSEIFLPKGPQDSFVPHTRRSLQLDHLFSFGPSFLWLMYQHGDMYSTNLVAAVDVLWLVATFPVVVALAGTGPAFSVGWLWRESLFSIRTANKK
ncbi:hypothetical protein B0H63DRAFT_564410 [Podospora didyma]|uniref:Uncharacterized protein n=1 Tax=Podospora didyma TaxID=330526 RepID=A0AAE0K4Z8_9PEZI|nr:hypothetical protein B0H63DRAFT_564410 [Podospora didyma]